MSRIITHPFREEAIIVEAGQLTRWMLSDPPHRLTQVVRASKDVPLLAMAPHVETFVLSAPPSEADGDECAVEVRHWTDLAVDETIVIPGSRTGLTSLALAPYGTWIAAADWQERVYLLDVLAKRIHSIGAGGSYTSGLTFSPNGRLLAAVCTFQGGGYITVWPVEQGRLGAARHLDRRALVWHTSMDFADTFAYLAFTPDARHLAVYATSSWLPEWQGWQGEVSLYDVEKGHILWQVPVVDQPFGDPFLSHLVFTANGSRIVRGSLTGEVVLLARADGTTIQRIPTGVVDGPTALAGDPLGRGIWTIESHGMPLFVSTTVT